MQTVSLNEVRFDPRRGVYWAEVRMERPGHVLRYQCEIHAPPGMDPVWVMNALTRQALVHSDRRRDGRIVH